MAVRSINHLRDVATAVLQEQQGVYPILS